MDDEADVRLVDPHAEGDGGAHDEAIFQQETPLALGPHIGIEPRMIGERRDARTFDGLGEVFGGVAGGGIDDARQTRTRLDEGDDPLGAVAFLGLCGEGEIGPVEARHMDGRLGEVELRENVVARTGVGRGGHCEARHTGEQILQTPERAIVRAEIMAPLADTVGLVHGNQRDLHLGKPLGQPRAHAFGRDIEQIHLAARGRLQRFGAGIEIHRGIQPLGAHADLFECIDLIGHQRDQRRDDNADTITQQRRDLVAKRLAAAGRQHGEAILAPQRVGDDILLQPPEGVIAIDALQQRAGIIKSWLGRHQPLVATQVSRGKSTGAFTQPRRTPRQETYGDGRRRGRHGHSRRRGRRRAGCRLIGRPAPRDRPARAIPHR